MTASPLPTPDAFSLRDPAVIACPWPYYEALHRAGGVHRDAETGIWLVAGYDQIQAILRDERFSARVDRPSLRPGGMPAAARAILAETLPATPTLVGADPPVHTRLRPLVNRVFSAARAEALAPAITEIVDDLIDQFVETRACDFVAAFAAPLPLTVIADQLGLDRTRIGDVKRWSDAIIEILGLMGSDERLEACARAQKEANDFLLAEAASRRAEPRDTLLSALANVRDEAGALLPETELLSILTQLLVAGNETTTNTLSAGMLRLASDPELQAQVREGDARTLRVFVEEVLRAESPVQGHYRRALEDVEIGGVAIPAGAVVHLRYGAGNRDARVFPHPEEIDLQRANASQHLAFGGGAHFCVGAMLARKELAIGFRRLLDRLEAITLAAAEDMLPRAPSAQHRGLLALPLRFEPRRI